MTALAKARPTPRRGDSPINDILELDLGSDAVVYQGGLVSVGSDGYAGATTGAVGQTVCGIAEADVDNTDAAADVVLIEHIGQDCYAADDQTVAIVATSRSRAGRVVGVDASGVWVEVRMTMFQSIPADSILGTMLDAFTSTEVTCTGSAQNVAHGLGRTPRFVMISPTELPADLAAGFDISEGTHTSTNVVFTGTSGAKVKVFCV
jgi:hypothetical protein